MFPHAQKPHAALRRRVQCDWIAHHDCHGLSPAVCGWKLSALNWIRAAQPWVMRQPSCRSILIWCLAICSNVHIINHKRIPPWAWVRRRLGFRRVRACCRLCLCHGSLKWVPWISNTPPTLSISTLAPSPVGVRLVIQRWVTNLSHTLQCPVHCVRHSMAFCHHESGGKCIWVMKPLCLYTRRIPHPLIFNLPLQRLC